MIELPKTLDAKKFFVLILVFLIATNSATLLDIPFLRQILGFLFLTILPGLLILQILKLNKMDLTEKFVLSVGISISFLMFFGLLINNLSLSIGYGTPLSTIPLLISFDLALVVLVIIGCKINKEQNFSLPNLNLTTSEKAFLVIPALFPALSIFGMHVMNTTDNNIVLMFLLILIPIYVVFVCFFNQKFPKRLYPVVIFLISISLLLLMALRSNHIIGMDTHGEYYFFRTTLDNLHWSIFRHSTLNACLAISLLPTIYQSILDISPEFLFKILYSLLFSIAPLAIYILSKRYVGELYGFLTSCFFMSLQNFLWTPVHARTNTAILFFALAMMILFSDKIDPLKKRILFIVFMASCMVSHYSTTYIFFFIILGTFIGIELLLKKYTVKKVISLTITILFFALIFFWYSQVTEAAFNSGVRFIGDTFSNLNRFFVEEMRSGTTQAVLGKDIGEKGIPHKIQFVFTWLTFAFIGIGIITLIRRYKEMSFPELNFENPDFLKDKFEVGYFVIALVCSGLLVAVIALPYVSTGYGMDRAHLLGIIILSIFFVIGGIIVAKYWDKLLSKKKIVKNKREVQAYVIILLVLVPYFLSTTGVTYQMFGVQRAITLNSEGKQYDMYYIHDQESYAGGWLEKYINPDNRKIYTDLWGTLKVADRVNVDTTKFDGRSLIEHKDINGYIYLRRRNVIDGILLNESNMYNITEYSDIFAVKNKIYGNGGSEVWR